MDPARTPYDREGSYERAQLAFCFWSCEPGALWLDSRQDVVECGLPNVCLLSGCKICQQHGCHQIC